MQKTINLNIFLENYHIERNSYYNFKTVNDIENVLKFARTLNDSNKEMKEFQTLIYELTCKNKPIQAQLQRNNHTYMQTFLIEKIGTHKRIDYTLLKNIQNNKRIPYASNLAPKTIFSNKITTNKTENILKVAEIEKKFVPFTKKEEFILLATESNFIDLQNYFALQLARRENFLCNILTDISNWIKKNRKVDKLDLLDYFFLKFYYNTALIKNFSNWLEYIQSFENYICQISYKKCNKQIFWEDANNFVLEESDYDDVFLAVNENHTFVFYDFFTSLKLIDMNKVLIDNGQAIIDNIEVELSKHVILTVASKNQICFLFPSNIKKNTIDKFNFIVHVFWDYLMAHGAFITLLLPEKSLLNNYIFFKYIASNKNIILKTKNLKYIYDFSKENELKIKNYQEGKI